MLVTSVRSKALIRIMTKKKFKICDMHCTSCAMNIDFDLEDIPGVKSAKTSYAKAECEVEFEEGKIKENEIIDQIKKTGYNAILG